MKPRTPTRYGPVAQSLHWLIAALILFQLYVGLTIDSYATFTKFTLIQWHKSIGLTVLILVFIRAMWRFTNPAPMLPAGTPLWQRVTAHTTHLMLYALMVLMPLSGWVFSDASGYHPNLFGLTVPVISTVDKPLSHTFKALHYWGGYAFLVLLALHLGAALYHHLIVRDAILTRMLPAWLKLPRPRLWLPLVAALLLPAAAHAYSWNTDYGASNITWQVPFNGQPVTGSFKSWYAKIFFNPDHIEAATIEVSIPTTSVESGDMGRDVTLRGPDWFNSTRYLNATFTSSKITKLAEGMYRAEGKFSLAGVTLPLSFPFTLTITGDTARAKGRFNLSRRDYLLGKGPWEKSSEIGDTVQVTFIVNATKDLK
ncbi:MAG: hypothetical protein GC129_03820 [Proteobacteria bacterium]|nr:hypothetical protein [Pseudomonadota bacterium]